MMFNAKLVLDKKSNEILLENLRGLMFKKNISEAELARQTAIPQPTLHKILSGKTEDPRISTLQILANYFDLTVDELFTGKKNTNISQTYLKTQPIPIISWMDCINGKNFLNKLTPTNWEHWVITESLAEYSFGLVSKPFMEPRFPKNTILIIDPKTQIKDGDLVVVHYPNTTEATLRELSIDGPSQLLLPINPNSPIDKWTPEIKILGVVVQARFSFEK